MVLAMKVLIMLYGVSFHLIRPLEIRFILYLFEDLVYRLPEHRVNYLGNSVPSMSSKIFFGSIVIISLRPKVSSVRGDYLRLPLPLLLILFNPFILINSIHQLMHASSRLHS